MQAPRCRVSLGNPAAQGCPTRPPTHPPPPCPAPSATHVCVALQPLGELDEAFDHQVVKLGQHAAGLVWRGARRCGGSGAGKHLGGRVAQQLEQRGKGVGAVAAGRQAPRVGRAGGVCRRYQLLPLVLPCQARQMVTIWLAQALTTQHHRPSTHPAPPPIHPRTWPPVS